MPSYEPTREFEHGQTETTGVLLVNLGTPDAPTTTSVRRFLKEFLSDPRVIEYPRLLWWLILNGIILRIRPSRSAKAYREVWTDEGSPLMLYSRALTERVRARLEEQSSGRFSVELAMTYGEPSVAGAIERLRLERARRILVLPLYPQYSATTTASVFDAVTKHLQGVRWVPEMRFVNQYHDDDGYIEALAASVRDHWAESGRGDHLMMSFHGVPQYTLDRGDPYHCLCQKTGRLLAEALGLGENDWTLSFQSRVGREEWLKPYTDETVRQLGERGVGRLDVICPGFSTDCLETLEEIAMQNAEFFTEAGGGTLSYIPALNTRDDHVTALTRLVERHTRGWPGS
ncbi:MAG: ferrochelatase [Gammaproteobacteria bacterium]|nr:ferrochelatase [Gammaproteobacteria bacterium]NNF50211.1 ferrochelatase [Woeseiaceae bacterium]MBT8094235.1 ferrochelatase [Gammaproteobacteria bacterium]MBT8104430.1 ferrochelatase [Gammaproteobacteria bacterium]NNK24446.1 ferrochelatase [Woeseiaceae bacterium]